jgi:predicted metal-dependent enzyme (double-stranded beta helix superfamily)
METTRAGTQVWPWPDSLDALVAAPGNHQLLFENEHVRVLEVRIRPGEIVPVHTHRWSSVVHLESDSDFIRRDGEGKLLFDSRNAGPPQSAPTVVWIGPLPPHSVENIGAAEIHIFTVELKHVTG